MRVLWEAQRLSLDRSVRSLQADRSFHQFKTEFPVLGTFADAVALLGFLAKGDEYLDEKDKVLAALVTLAQRPRDRPLAGALLWLGLWPALTGIVWRRRRYYVSDPAEHLSDVGSAFETVIQRLDLENTSRVAATIVMNTERVLVERRRSAWKRNPLALTHDVDALADSLLTVDGATAGSPSTARLEALRARLEVVLGKDTDLVLAVIVGDEKQHEAAARLGLSAAATRKRLDRALDRLREHLAKGGAHNLDGLPLSGASGRRPPPRK